MQQTLLIWDAGHGFPTLAVNLHIMIVLGNEVPLSCLSLWERWLSAAKPERVR